MTRLVCHHRIGLQLFGVHKERPPGLFDFSERSVQYFIGFWLAAGLVLSVIVHTGLLVWRDFRRESPERNPTSLEASALSHKPASAKTPPPAEAVRY